MLKSNVLRVAAISALLLAAGTSCRTHKKAAKLDAPLAGPVSLAVAPEAVKAPAPRAEFRGLWVASVANINWPSKPGLTVEQQKAELIHLLDKAVEYNLNAILFQVRPSTDAMYESKLEPWSAYLTGTQGKAPEPKYDPLAFAVEEAHKRGLELHAWINPFRVKPKDAKWQGSKDGLAARHPQWVRSYGGLLWLDPGEPAARDHSLAVLRDIVARYDIDGLHIDDYFYPYKERDKAGNEVPFPDAELYAKYGNGMSVNDWRRANINDFVKRMYEDTKAAKPWVKVGISPFGIWRPNNPAQIRGFDAYDQIYGDSKLWLKQGWADYFSPQLYWPIEQTPQSFPVLLNWWIGENTLGRHLWPGLYTTRADSSAGQRATWPIEQVEYQIKTTRGFAGSTGTVHFSASWLEQTKLPASRPVGPHLVETVYQEPALIPASPWIPGGLTLPAPAAAEVAAASDGTTITLSFPAHAQARVYAVQYASKGARDTLTWKQTVIAPEGGKVNVELPARDLAAVSITPVDRLGTQGTRTTLTVGAVELPVAAPRENVMP